MRWLHLVPDTPADVAARTRVQQRIDAWWTAFTGVADELGKVFRRESEFDLVGFMREHLAAVHPELMWEFGPPAARGSHRLVITPEGRHELRPLVDRLLASAPAIGWEFYAYRLPEPPDAMRRAVAARTGQPFEAKRVHLTVGDDSRLELTWELPDPDADPAWSQAFIASEALLGEQTLVRQVGHIGVEAELGGRGIVPVDNLAATVASVLESRRHQMPDRPVGELSEDATWTLWRLEPEPANDYARQFDLAISRSCLPAMWKSAHSEAVFASERYSRHGETFAYVKIDAHGVNDDRSDKEAIEEALTEQLRARDLGGVCGAGTGLRYGYIDLALTDVEAAIPVVRDVLIAAGAPTRTWLLFHDSHLAWEWVGAHDDTPPPKLEPEPDMPEAD